MKGGQAREKASRLFTQDIWTRLSEDSPLWRVLEENPSRDYFHPCAGEDCHKVLSRLPVQLTDSVKAIVLRRLPRLDERLGIEARKRYYCVIMNSFPRSLSLDWARKPGEATFRHFAPWCSQWVHGPSGWQLKWTAQEVKRYYLYHLFLHEIGHLNEPARGNLKNSEVFAENFALEWARRLGEL